MAHQKQKGHPLWVSFLFVVPCTMNRTQHIALWCMGTKHCYAVSCGDIVRRSKFPCASALRSHHRNLTSCRVTCALGIFSLRVPTSGQDKHTPRCQTEYHSSYSLKVNPSVFNFSLISSREFRPRFRTLYISSSVLAVKSPTV